MILNYKFFTLLFILISFIKISFTQPSTISIENEFIKLIVNQKPSDIGRFAIETTQGDPANDKDDYAPLIFGRPL